MPLRPRSLSLSPTPSVPADGHGMSMGLIPRYLGRVDRVDRVVPGTYTPFSPYQSLTSLLL